MSERSPTGRKVFIANVSGHDYTRAKRFGDLIGVTQRRVDITHTDRLELDVQSVLRNASDKDYLLVSGSPVVNALCIAYLLNKHGHVNMLFWDALERDYILRTINGEERSSGFAATE